MQEVRHLRQGDIDDTHKDGAHAEMGDKGLITPATQAYVSAIEAAALCDNANGGGRLLGHL